MGREAFCFMSPRLLQKLTVTKVNYSTFTDFDGDAHCPMQKRQGKRDFSANPRDLAYSRREPPVPRVTHSFPSRSRRLNAVLF